MKICKNSVIYIKLKQNYSIKVQSKVFSSVKNYVHNSFLLCRIMYADDTYAF